MEPVGQADPGDGAIDYVQLFTEYAHAARGTAVKNHAKNDMFGESLALARADVYEEAAAMVRRMPIDEVAPAMIDRARAAHVRTPPLIDFDRAGLQYIASRAWQFCALTIDDSQPQVAPKWE